MNLSATPQIMKAVKRTYQKPLRFKSCNSFKFHEILKERQTQNGQKEKLELNDMSGRVHGPSVLKYNCSTIYTACPGGTCQDFGRMFLTLKYTDITQNTYIRS